MATEVYEKIRQLEAKVTALEEDKLNMVRARIYSEDTLQAKLTALQAVVDAQRKALEKIARIPTNMKSLGENWTARMATHGAEARDTAIAVLGQVVDIVPDMEAVDREFLEHDSEHPPATATEKQGLRDALEDIMDYTGGAENALEDPYVMDRARAALNPPTTVESESARGGRCPDSVESATGTFDPAGYDVMDVCAGCGMAREDHDPPTTEPAQPLSDGGGIGSGDGGGVGDEFGRHGCR